MNGVHFSHKSDEWATPSWLYDFFIHNGYIDPCPLGATDGLESPWFGKVFVNPPYSNIKAFVEHFLYSLNFNRDLKGWFLVPARTDTSWFATLFACASKVWFISRRLCFGDETSNAPFPSCLLYVEDRDYNDYRQVLCIDRDALLLNLSYQEAKEKVLHGAKI